MTSETNTLSLLTFQVADQTYAIPVARVVRIVQMVAITYLPQLPQAVRGVINFHGTILPVLDLRERFELTPLAYGLHTPIVLAEADGRFLGIVVDKVHTVTEISLTDVAARSAIFPPESDAAAQHAPQNQYIAQLVKTKQQILPVLDVQHLLSPQEKSQVTQAITTITPEGAAS